MDNKQYPFLLDNDDLRILKIAIEQTAWDSKDAYKAHKLKMIFSAYYEEPLEDMIDRYAVK